MRKRIPLEFVDKCSFILKQNDEAELWTMNAKITLYELVIICGLNEIFDDLLNDSCFGKFHFS